MASVRHLWTLIAMDKGSRKDRCSMCGCVRLKINHSDRFPSVRYTMAGVQTNKAPLCAMKIAPVSVAYPAGAMGESQ
jgi:hypothetical protein